ncbi:MAG: YggT family protein [Thermodesulfobacteriota bacterium]
MDFLLYLVDTYIVILLLRLLIKPNEAYFSPIYRLIYRITDPVIKLFSGLSRSLIWQGLLSVLVVVLLRGFIYASAGSAELGIGIGASLMEFFQLLFRVYVALWLVMVLSQWSFGGSPFALLERAFHPFNRLSWRLRVRRNRYYLFVLLVLFGAYILLSGIVNFVLLGANTFEVFLPYGLLKALGLVLSLFPFPGFFSLVVIVGALLSWVSPDPSNPVVRAIYGLSEPLLAPFRRIIPLIGGLDLSPIVALFCFEVIGKLGKLIP